MVKSPHHIGFIVSVFIDFWMETMDDEISLQCTDLPGLAHSHKHRQDVIFEGGLLRGVDHGLQNTRTHQLSTIRCTWLRICNSKQIQFQE